MIEDDEAIPGPSDLDAITRDPDNKDGFAILVAVKTAAPKSVRRTQ
jgi:hypothetical protein